MWLCPAAPPPHLQAPAAVKTRPCAQTDINSKYNNGITSDNGNDIDIDNDNDEDNDKIMMMII